MDDKFLTILINIVLLIFGGIQIVFLRSQKKHTRISLTEQYRSLWDHLKKDWGNIVFIGRERDEYYQVLNNTQLKNLKNKIEKGKDNHPTIWALESVRKICGVLGEVSTRILQGHLKVSDVYPIFGTEFLRQSRALRQLLEPHYKFLIHPNDIDETHMSIREELQDWLIYHDGLRRRCLIMIDLLWAEAVRLKDLPPDDTKSAADAKENTGSLNRKRVFQETRRLNGITGMFLGLSLSRFLRKSEYRSFSNWEGINKKKLSNLDREWTKRILREETK